MSLQSGPTLVGTVRDRAGAPVAGARVHVFTRFGTFDAGRPTRLGDTWWPPISTTDAGGEFTYSGPSASGEGHPACDASQVIRVEHPAFEPVDCCDIQDRVPARGDGRCDLVLTNPAAESPQPSVPVEPRAVLDLVVRGHDADGSVCLQLAAALNYSLSLPRKPDGSVAPLSVPHGTYRAVAREPGRAPRAFRLRVGPHGCRPRQIRLKRGRTVTGRVVDATGQPVAGCYVQCSNIRAHVSPASQATTDVDGRYELHNVHGWTWISFQATGYAHAARIRLIPTWLPRRARVNAILARPCTLAGRVVDHHGRGAGGARVHVDSRGPGPSSASGYNTFTDENGAFRFDQLPRGRALVHAGDAQAEVHLESGNEVNVDLHMSTPCRQGNSEP